MSILEFGCASRESHECGSPEVINENGNESLSIEFPACDECKELIERECQEPWNAQEDGRESVVNGKGIESSKRSVKSESTALFTNQLFSFILFLNICRR